MEHLSFGKKYRLGPQIGFTLDEEIFLGTEIASNEKVLIKRESSYSKYPKLRSESERCKLLAGGVGIPKFKDFHVLGENRFLVMGMPYGPSLEELFNVCSRKFTLKTVLMLAFQMIDRVEFMHSRSFLHGDISPYNFSMGLGKDENRVYVSGFDMSKSFQEKTCSHIPFRPKKSLFGTERYAIIDTLSEFEQSRRDDLESLGYVLVYFLRGRFPWQGNNVGTMVARCQMFPWQGNNVGTMEERCEMKCEKVAVEVLSEGYPPEFASYFHCCRSLRFDMKQDYLHLKRIFHDLFVREGFQYDSAFDWKIKQSQMVPSEDEGGDAEAVCSSEGVCSEGAALESVLEHLNFKSL